MNKYLRVIQQVGGAAVIVVVVGLIFGVITGGEYTSVIVQAIPFVSIFVAIILLFALSIVLVAMRFNGQIPQRTHRPIELTIIGGIISGVVLLFQSWHMIGYAYGFPLLLGATLGFILWSHVIPKSALLSAALPKFTPTQHIAGLIAGVIVGLVVFGAFFASGQPQEPYGMRQRQWDSLSEEAQAEIAAEAQVDFARVSIPFFAMLGVFPGLIIYFGVRELTAGAATKPETDLPAGSPKPASEIA